MNVLQPRSGGEIPLAPGSRLEATATELIYSHSYDGPGVTAGDSLYRGAFATYAGIFGLPADTVLVSGTGLVGYRSYGNASSFDTETSVSGHIEYVHPTLLAGLGLRPDFQRGHADFQIANYAGAYAAIDLTSIPEPGTEYIVGLGFILLAAGAHLLLRRLEPATLS